MNHESAERKQGGTVISRICSLPGGYRIGRVVGTGAIVLYSCGMSFGEFRTVEDARKHCLHLLRAENEARSDMYNWDFKTGYDAQ